MTFSSAKMLMFQRCASACIPGVELIETISTPGFHRGSIRSSPASPRLGATFARLVAWGGPRGVAGVVAEGVGGGLRAANHTASVLDHRTSLVKGATSEGASSDRH